MQGIGLASIPASVLDLVAALKGGASGADAAPAAEASMPPSNTFADGGGLYTPQGMADPNQADAFGPAPNVVKTVPVGPADAVRPAPATASSKPGGGSTDVQELLAALRSRMMARQAPPSGRERLGNMLIEFGRGMAASASNIAGRKRGPGLAESFAGGASAMGAQAMKENDDRRKLDAAEQARIDAMLGKYSSTALSAAKLDELRGYHNDMTDIARKKLDNDPLAKYILPTIIKNATDRGEPVTMNDVLSMAQALAARDRSGSIPGLNIPDFADTDTPEE